MAVLRCRRRSAVRREAIRSRGVSRCAIGFLRNATSSVLSSTLSSPAQSPACGERSAAFRAMRFATASSPSSPPRSSSQHGRDRPSSHRSEIRSCSIKSGGRVPPVAERRPADGGPPAGPDTVAGVAPARAFRPCPGELGRGEGLRALGIGNFRRPTRNRRAANSSRRPRRTASMSAGIAERAEEGKRPLLAVFLAHEQQRHARREQQQAARQPLRGGRKDACRSDRLGRDFPPDRGSARRRRIACGRSRPRGCRGGGGERAVTTVVHEHVVQRLGQVRRPGRNPGNSRRARRSAARGRCGENRRSKRRPARSRRAPAGGSGGRRSGCSRR